VVGRCPDGCRCNFGTSAAVGLRSGQEHRVVGSRHSGKEVPTGRREREADLDEMEAGWNSL